MLDGIHPGSVADIRCRIQARGRSTAFPFIQAEWYSEGQMGSSHCFSFASIFVARTLMACKKHAWQVPLDSRGDRTATHNKSCLPVYVLLELFDLAFAIFDILLQGELGSLSARQASCMRRGPSEVGPRATSRTLFANSACLPEPSQCPAASWPRSEPKKLRGCTRP